MFAVDAKLTHLALTRQQVLALTQSMNAITVQVPGFPVAPALGYVLSYTAAEGQAAIVIVLHYGDSGRTVAYVPDPPSFPSAELPRFSEEAALFLESMGFILDDMAFATLNPAEQDALLARTPLLRPETPAAAVAGAPPRSPAANPRSEAIGRLLMSF